MKVKQLLRIVLSLFLAVLIVCSTSYTPAYMNTEQTKSNAYVSQENSLESADLQNEAQVDSNIAGTDDKCGREMNIKEFNRFIIKFKNDDAKNRLEDVLKDKLKGKKKLRKNNLNLFITKNKMKHDEILDLIKSHNLDSKIEYIQPDYEMELSSQDPLFDQQWGIYNKDTIQASYYDETVKNSVYSEVYGFEYRVDANVVPAWDISQGEGVTVAVIDTGIDITHEDLKDNIWINSSEIPDNGIDDDNNGYVDDTYGWNFYDDNNLVHSTNTVNDEEHGTHVAGIIATVKDNGIGIAGVAPKAKVMPLKVFSNGTAYTSDIIEAIEYAEKMGAKVANCSWGTRNENPALKEAIEDSNMLFVCAAGNSGVNIDTNPVYPASYDLGNVISVTSINKEGMLSSFSNYGENSVDVATPGEEIISTLPVNTYGRKSGTSMAAGFVSGEAAQVMHKYSDATADWIMAKIIKTSSRLPILDNEVKRENIINCESAVIGISNDQNTQVAKNEEMSVSNSVYENNEEESVIDSVYSSLEEIELLSSTSQTYFSTSTTFNTSTNYNIVGGSTEIGVFASLGNARVSIVDIMHPQTGNTVKAIRLNGGSSVPTITSPELALRRDATYIVEFDYWSDIDNVKFDVDLYPDDLPQIFPIAKKQVQHCKWVFSCGSYQMDNARLRFFNDIVIPNPSNIYITNVQLYEKIDTEMFEVINNLIGGSTGIGIFQYAQKTGAETYNMSHPLTGESVKIIRLKKGYYVPVIETSKISLKPNVTYVFAFDYWSDVGNVNFNVDLYPDDLPENHPTACCSVQRFKWVFSSSSANMGNASLRFFNDLQVPNPGNIFITNIQLYEKVDDVSNMVGGSTEVGTFINAGNSGVSIVDVTYPQTGRTIKAVRLNAGASVPTARSSPMFPIKPKVSYLVEFDYWSDIDNVNFNVDLYPNDLPQQCLIAKKEVQHCRWIVGSSSANMSGASLRFFNDVVVPNPSNIYISNIQLYTIPTAEPYKAEIVRNTIPDVMYAGISYKVDITFRNKGPNIWKKELNYRLGAATGTDPFASARQFMNDNELIVFNQEKTFSFTMTAPTTPGTYTTNWRLLREGVTWFGPVFSKNITVINLFNAPANISATSTDSSISLTWDAVQGATGYDIEVDGVVFDNGNNTTYTHSGLITSSKHTYRVRAKNSIGGGAWSQETVVYAMAVYAKYQYEYNVNNQLVKIIKDNVAILDFVYDDNGNLINVHVIDQ